MSDAALVAALTWTAAILLAPRFPCRDLTVASLEYGYQLHPVTTFGGGTFCARAYEQCGGAGWHGPTCCVGESEGQASLPSPPRNRRVAAA